MECRPGWHGSIRRSSGDRQRCHAARGSQRAQDARPGSPGGESVARREARNPPSPAIKPQLIQQRPGSESSHREAKFKGDVSAGCCDQHVLVRLASPSIGGSARVLAPKRRRTRVTKMRA